MKNKLSKLIPLVLMIAAVACAMAPTTAPPDTSNYQSHILAQSTHRHRPVYGPITKKQNALYIPMSGGYEITRRDDDGTFRWNETDPAKVVAWMKRRGIDPNYDGYLCFDWEPYVKHSGPFSDAIEGYRDAYEAAKMYAPNAIVGFFGPPGVRGRDAEGNKGYQNAAFWADFMAIPDVLFVQNYIASSRPLRLTTRHRERIIEQVGIAVDSGKRVVSVLSWRMGVAGGGRVPMPPELAAELASVIVEAHPSIDGFLLWGWSGGTSQYVKRYDEQKADLLRALWPVVRQLPSNIHVPVSDEEEDEAGRELRPAPGDQRTNGVDDG